MAHFFCIFHALSFELNFFRLEFPFNWILYRQGYFMNFSVPKLK